MSGYSVSMSSDGTRVAIGAPYNDGNGEPMPGTCACTPRAAGRGPRWAPTSTARLRETAPGFRYRCLRTARAWPSALHITTAPADAGHVRVYAESGGTWTQVGADIDGEAAGDQSGRSVSMSSDGTRLAIGAISNDGSAANAGHVRVYAESGWDVDPGWRRHRRRGCERQLRELGIDVVGRHARGDRRSIQQRRRQLRRRSRARVCIRRCEDRCAREVGSGWRRHRRRGDIPVRQIWVLGIVVRGR